VAVLVPGTVGVRASEGVKTGDGEMTDNGEIAVRSEGLALLSDLEAAGAISTIGLHLTDPDLPYEQFMALCVLLGKMHQAVRFAIGDAIILGEQLYGERSYQALESLNLSEKGMMEYVRVSQRVPRSRRRKDLSWSHHRAVAPLEPPQQKEWLKTAADQGMSHHALRDALRPISEAPVAETCHCCGQAL
jgi:hypothetical protein